MWIVIFSCSASFLASLLGLTLNAIKTAFDALVNEISVSVTASDFALSGDYKLLLGVYNSEVNISKYIDVIIEP